MPTTTEELFTLNSVSIRSAIEDFNNAIRLKPDDADTYFNRGFVYFNQGNIISGCEDAKRPVN